MALKRPYQNLSTFSMSSMTDVIFLALDFLYGYIYFNLSFCYRCKPASKR